MISPLSIHFTLLSPEQQTFVRELYNVVDRATHEEHVEENNKFSNAFIHAASLPPGEYDRPYLMNGYLPICLEIRKCITCTHPYCDEPNSNRVAQQSNEAAKMRYDAQCASDQNAWDRGESVYNTNGVVLKEGRKRPPPQYAQLILNCHCEQFNCSSDVGVVPERECPIQCIDESTGERFAMDQNGMCLCHICACTGCPRFYTVSLVFVLFARNFYSHIILLS